MTLHSAINKGKRGRNCITKQGDLIVNDRRKCANLISKENFPPFFGPTFSTKTTQVNSDPKIFLVYYSNPCNVQTETLFTKALNFDIHTYVNELLLQRYKKQFCIIIIFCKQGNFHKIVIKNNLLFFGFRQYVVLVLKVPLCFDKTSASTASFPIQIYISPPLWCSW